MSVIDAVLVGASIASFAYFVLLNLINTAFTLGAWQSITRHLRTREYDAVKETSRHP